LESRDTILLILDNKTMTEKELELIKFVHWLNNPWVAFGLTVLTIWTLAWKGTALWKAVKNGSLPWFITILVINTCGILEIIYIFFFSEKKEK